MPEGQEQIQEQVVESAAAVSTLETGITGWLNAKGEAFHQAINSTFQEPMQAIFQPMNAVLTPIPPICWSLAAVSLFIGAMIWVWSMKREYVNLDAPSKHWWCDLRYWTILSMLPHLFVYLYI